MKILVISDIHGNAEALRAVMRTEPDADHTICLGDMLLSGPQANETFELLEELDPTTAIMGNHDEEVLDPTLYAKLPPEWIALNDWLLERLDKAAFTRLAAYQPAGHFKIGGIDMFLHHGELPKPTEPALPDSPESSFTALEAHGCEWVLFGHTHIQFSRLVDGVTYINPGSVGQPRTGKVQACYGVIEDGSYSARQVAFDSEPWLAALDRIDALRPYPDFHRWLSEGLLSGYGLGQRDPWLSYATRGFN